MEQVQESAREIRTERLLLRPHNMADAPAIAELCGNYNVSKWTTNIPHPYSLQDAEDFISLCQAWWKNGKDCAFVITLHDTGQIIGTIGAHMREAGEFEVGYWLGEPFWKKGYATETAIAMIGYIREKRNPERIWAGYADGNAASARVLEKAGFVKLGASKCVASKAQQKEMTCNLMELQM
ncbi:MAG: GNAT family N-acetyltransferase [Methyloligellaceae bacterium]